MKDTENKQHKNMISCAKYLIATHGCMRLFRGKILVPRILRIGNLSVMDYQKIFQGTISNLLRMWSSGLALALNDLLQNVIYDSLESDLNCR